MEYVPKYVTDLRMHPFVVLLDQQKLLLAKVDFFLLVDFKETTEAYGLTYLQNSWIQPSTNSTPFRKKIEK